MVDDEFRHEYIDMSIIAAKYLKRQKSMKTLTDQLFREQFY